MAGKERLTKLKIDSVVKKVYNTRNGDVVALNGVDLDIKENEFICVVGPSGCGKSTLLNITAGLKCRQKVLYTLTIRRLKAQALSVVLFSSSMHFSLG